MIPSELLQQLTDLKPLLREQGILQCRYDRRPYCWRLRVRGEDDEGERRHRSIRIGEDGELALDVQELLDKWRAEREAELAEAALQQQQSKKQARGRQELLRNVETFAGGSRRYQKQVRREFDQRYQRDLAYGLMFCLAPQIFLPHRRSAGRPPKSRLW